MLLAQSNQGTCGIHRTEVKRTQNFMREGRGLLGRPLRRLEDNIKINLKILR